MINTNRIVPVTKIDLITLYGLILLQDSNNSALAKLAATDVEGDYAVSASGVYLADQPLQSATFGSSVTSGTVYFVPAFDYAGFSKTGATLTVTNPTGGVVADGHTLYKAVLSTNALTITQVGF